MLRFEFRWLKLHLIFLLRQKREILLINQGSITIFENQLLSVAGNSVSRLCYLGCFALLTEIIILYSRVGSWLVSKSDELPFCCTRPISNLHRLVQNSLYALRSPLDLDTSTTQCAGVTWITSAESVRSSMLLDSNLMS